MLDAVGDGWRQFRVGFGTRLIQRKADQSRNPADGSSFRIGGKRLPNRHRYIKSKIGPGYLFRDAVGAPFRFFRGGENQSGIQDIGRLQEEADRENCE